MTAVEYIAGIMLNQSIYNVVECLYNPIYNLLIAF